MPVRLGAARSASSLQASLDRLGGGDVPHIQANDRTRRMRPPARSARCLRGSPPSARVTASSSEMPTRSM